MRFLILSSCIFLALTSYGQSSGSEAFHGFVNKLRLDSIPGPYAQIEMNKSDYSWQKNDVYFDYKGNGHYISDSTGEAIRFYSMASVLNFLDGYGWEYLDTIHKGEKAVILLRKKAQPGEKK